MKYLSEFSQYQDGGFTKEEFQDVKSLYIDMTDDLDLFDVKTKAELDSAMTSTLSWIGKVGSDSPFRIEFAIRTATLKGYQDYNVYAVASKQDQDNYKKVKDYLLSLKVRLEDMGFKVILSDIDVKLNSWNYLTSGIKMWIEKN